MFERVHNCDAEIFRLLPESFSRPVEKLVIDHAEKSSVN